MLQWQLLAAAALSPTVVASVRGVSGTTEPVCANDWLRAATTSMRATEPPAEPEACCSSRWRRACCGAAGERGEPSLLLLLSASHGAIGADNGGLKTSCGLRGW
jgi:hypothetical protein